MLSVQPADRATEVMAEISKSGDTKKQNGSKEKWPGSTH